jgi:hypothetical protein
MHKNTAKERRNILSLAAIAAIAAIIAMTAKIKNIGI